MKNHVFISYAHVDNEPAIPQGKGWITNFHVALRSFLGQYFNEKPIEIWRDKKIGGNMLLRKTVFGNLLDSRILVCIISPNYMESDWCLDELNTFCGGTDIYVGDKMRISKVLKIPVSLEEIPETLRETIGYKFFTFETDDLIIFNPDFGDYHEAKFLYHVSDLAFEISKLLREMREIDAQSKPSDKMVSPGSDKMVSPGDDLAQPSTPDGLYLALPPDDMWEQYHNIRRDLARRNIRVLPNDFDIPKAAEIEVFKELVRENLRQSKFAVHLLDKNYIEQAGAKNSYINLQLSLAAERVAQPDFSRLIWLGEDLQAEDERAKDIVSQIMKSSPDGVDILTTSLEKFKTAILDGYSKEPPKSVQSKSSSEARKVYVLYDKDDVDSAQKVENELIESFGCEVLPASEYLFLKGDDSEPKIIEAHNQYLRECDGVLIYWRSPSAPWVRAKLSDLEKAKGIERQKDFRAKGIYLGDLEKQTGFRTLEAMILKSQEDLPQFVKKLKNGGKI